VSPEEYCNLEQVEALHWYYAGKRDIVRHWLAKRCKIDSSLRLLDCGAGSGAFAAAMHKSVKVIAMDDHEESLEILRKRLPPEAVVRGSCTSIPFPDDSFDAVTALDVLEHVPAHHDAVKEMIRVVRPGAPIVITVPAMMCLWSDWDTSLHHQRRYSKPELLGLFHHLPVKIDHCTYINVLATPLVWLARKARAIGLGTGSRAEDHIPMMPINWLLRQAFVRPANLRIQFPFGVGLILVAHKNETRR
jgi:SAM-dependent methyltransferase